MLGAAIVSIIERLSSLWRLKCTSVIEKGSQNVSFIERLSSLWRLKCTSVIDLGPQNVSFIERLFFYCVLYSECPLSEVLLYSPCQKCWVCPSLLECGQDDISSTVSAKSGRSTAPVASGSSCSEPVPALLWC